MIQQDENAINYQRDQLAKGKIKDLEIPYEAAYKAFMTKLFTDDKSGMEGLKPFYIDYITKMFNIDNFWTWLE